MRILHHDAASCIFPADPRRAPMGSVQTHHWRPPMNRPNRCSTASRRQFLALAPASGLSMFLGASAVSAQPALSGTARVLCPTPAGSTVDVVARRIAEAMKGHYATQVVVEN